MVIFSKVVFCGRAQIDLTNANIFANNFERKTREKTFWQKLKVGCGSSMYLFLFPKKQ